jgi:hypothetical protein
MKLIHSVAGDGNCLYNSIAYGILLRENKTIPKKKEYKALAKVLRDLMVTRMRTFILSAKLTNTNVIDTLYQMSGSQLEENNDSNDNYDNVENLTLEKIKSLSHNYINRMSVNGEWGGHLEIKFLNEILKNSFNYKGLVVYDADTLKEWKSLSVPLKGSGKLPITIIHIRNQHFDYLEIKNGCNSNSNSNVKNKLRRRGSFPK